MAIYKGRVAIDCDEAAIDLKKVIYDYLKKQGVPVRTWIIWAGKRRTTLKSVSIWNRRSGGAIMIGVF